MAKKTTAYWGFQFLPHPRLTSKRLLLRPVISTDTKALLALRSNKNVNDYITRKIPKNLADIERFIENIHQLVAKNKALFWGITLKNNNQFVGTIGIRNFMMGANNAEIGYEMIPSEQQKGLMSEALETVLNFSFNTLHLKNLEAFTHKNNLPSISLLKKYHFILQPHRRDKGFENNRIFKLENSNNKTV